MKRLVSVLGLAALFILPASLSHACTGVGEISRIVTSPAGAQIFVRSAWPQAVTFQFNANSSFLIVTAVGAKGSGQRVTITNGPGACGPVLNNVIPGGAATEITISPP